MPSASYESLLAETKKSLERIQSFDVNSLIQEKELGAKQNFSDAVPFATKCVNYARLISVESLRDIPEGSLGTLRDQLNSVYSVFDQILQFSPDKQGPRERQQFINQCESTYTQFYANCLPYISFSVGRTADFKRLENEGRAAVQLVKDQTNELIHSLKTREEEGKQILEEIRKVAAEQGVSQQAHYFRDESETHARESEIWRNRMIRLSWALGTYAVLTLFLHRIPIIAPTNVYETAQLAISKILIFGVLSFLVYLSTKNFLAHKHNSIVNKHRQNGLMTYKALVDAAGTLQSKEVILNHAAASIFSPQATGYSADNSSEGTTAKSVVELIGGTISNKSQ